MQALIELLVNFIAALVAVALSQFGLNMDQPNKPEREIHRVRDCNGNSGISVVNISQDRQQDC